MIQNLTHMHCAVLWYCFHAIPSSSTSPHQWGIPEASLLLEDPAEGGTCEYRGNPVRKWLFKSMYQLLCLLNEESCCYWWQQNYLSVISGGDNSGSQLIVQKHLIYTELTLATCRSRSWTKMERVISGQSLSLCFGLPDHLSVTAFHWLNHVDIVGRQKCNIST